MSIGLWLAAGAITFCDLCLIAICIRRQVVLGGATGIAGLGAVTFAISLGVTGNAARAVLGAALVSLILGTALLRLGRFLERLLQDPPGSQDQ